MAGGEKNWPELHIIQTHAMWFYSWYTGWYQYSMIKPQTTNHCIGSVTYLSRSSFSESIPNRDWLCTRQLESIFTQHFQTYWQPFYSDDCTDIKALFKKLSASPHKHFKRGSMKYIHTTKYWWLELKSYIFQNTRQLLHFTCFGFISGTTSGFYNDGRWHSE